MTSLKNVKVPSITIENSVNNNIKEIDFCAGRGYCYRSSEWVWKYNFF